MKKTHFYLFAFLIGAACLIVILKSPWRDNSKSLGIDMKARSYAKQTSEWARGQFFSLKNFQAADFESQLKTVIRDLSTAETTELITIITSCFEYLSDPTYEDYVVLKSRQGQHAVSTEGFGKQSETVGFGGSDIWQTFYVNSTNRPFGVRKVTEINLSTLAFGNAWIYTNQSGVGRLSLATSQNFAATLRSGLIQVEESPELILQRDGKIRCVTIGGIAKFNTVDEPGPLHISFYWSPIKQRWYPWQMAIDSTTGFYVLF